MIYNFIYFFKLPNQSNSLLLQQLFKRPALIDLSILPSPQVKNNITQFCEPVQVIVNTVTKMSLYYL